MDASLFLTEVDIHHPKPLIGKDLRAYIIQHSLFFEKLLVGDSQFNNNPSFRQLMWNKEPEPLTEPCPQDFWELSESGFLIPAVRNEYESLAALRKDHVSRNVETPPSEEYAFLMDSKVRGKIETYHIRDVSVAFRERVLEALDSEDNTGRGKLSKKTAAFVKDYVLRQDPLLFASFRDWMRQQIKDGQMNSRDYFLVDRLTAGAYRHNVAIALNKNLDIPSSHSRDIYPITITVGSTEKKARPQPEIKAYIKPSLVLSRNILSLVPAAAVREVKKSINHTTVVSKLEKFRTTGDIEWEAFLSDLEIYLGELDMTFSDYLTGKQKAEIQEAKKKDTKKAWVKGIFDTSVSVISLVPGIGPIIAGTLGAYGLISATHGAISDIRDKNRQTDRIQGWIACRSNSLEKLYEIKK